MRLRPFLFGATLLCLSPLAFAQTPAETATEKTIQYFDQIANNPPALAVFLRSMPKGGDLHVHLDGATYAENLIAYGAKQNFCLDPTTDNVSQSANCVSANNFKSLSDNPDLYEAAVGAWSMKDYTQFSADSLAHFFSTFLKFEPLIPANTANIIAEIANRAGSQNENYLEIMVMNFMLGISSPDGEDPAAKIGDHIGYNSNFAVMQNELIKNGINPIIQEAVNKINLADKNAQTIMQCGTKNPQAGCNVKIRYQFVTFRDLPPQEVFAELAEAFAVANADSKVVAINIVLPENWPIALRDYHLHMQMIAFQHQLYPNVHITLHAGELAPRQVPPSDLTFHIRDAIETAHAERIGHGVDIAYENNANQLLKEMAEKQILVEVNLTSNADILGLKGKAHPLPLYLAAGVPVALSTDDEGVLRTDLTQEFLRATLTYHLSYPMLKKLARNSLTYSFLPGASIWQNAKNATPVNACENDQLGSNNPSPTCADFLKQSEKARQQWLLESQFETFEAGF